MRALALFIALAGCGFRSSAAPDAPAVEPDASEPQDAPATAATPFCDPADPHLMVCYELDGSGHDGSSHHLDATTTNVAFAEGEVGMAMRFDDTSTADVADSAVFDVPAVTIEAWIRLARLPASRAIILDVNNQYNLVVRDNGDLQCALVGGPDELQGAAHVTVDQWAHVACTYDGAGAGALYVNGMEISNATGGKALHTSGTTGMSLADNNPSGSDPSERLIGLLDQVRLFDVARTASQICQDAGHTSCP
jgi:Concanavalin A-like lectin/glucanases superfamily